MDLIEIFSDIDSGKRKADNIVTKILLEGIIKKSTQDEMAPYKDRIKDILGAKSEVTDINQILGDIGTNQGTQQLYDNGNASSEPEMMELGMKDKIFGVELLQELKGIHGKPTTYPRLPEGHYVICGYDQGLGERMIVCKNLAAMKYLYELYNQGSALRINWYSGEDPGFITVL